MTDDRDPVDERLRAYGERWRSALPEPRTVDAGTVTETSRSRGWWLASAAAAAVLVVVLGIVLATRDRPGESPAPTLSTPSADVVPWKPLPATQPTLPLRRPPALPEAAGYPRCEPGALKPGKREVDAAAGTMYLSVQLDLVGSAPCRLQGYPEGELSDHGRPIQVVTTFWADDSPQGKSAPVLVTKTSPAVLTFAWGVSHFCPTVDNDRLRITLPDGWTSFTVAGFGRSYCTPGEPASRLMIQPIHTDRDQPQPFSPYDQIRVTGDLAMTVPAGAPVKFQVTLTSPKDLVLDPCPDYTVLTAAGEQRWALNCAGVRHRNQDGLPYLPAGVPVTFAMEGDTGGRSTPKFLWALDTPQHAVAIGAPLTVGNDALQGQVSGVVTMDGGPAPGISVKVTSGKVRAVGANLTRTAPINADGTYKLALPPGKYRIRATTPQYNVGHDFSCFALEPITVRSGRATTANVSCPME